MKKVAQVLFVVIVLTFLGLQIGLPKDVCAKEKTKKAVVVKRYKKTRKYPQRFYYRRTTIYTNYRLKKKVVTDRCDAKTIKKVTNILRMVRIKYSRRTKTVTTSKTVKMTTYTTNRIIQAGFKPRQLRETVDGNIVNAWNRSGFDIVVDEDSPILEGRSGVFSSDRGKIILKDNVETTLIHELGHFVDYYHGYISDGNAFARIYSAEKRQFKGPNAAYARRSTEEYYAEAFRMYYSNNRLLRSACPRTYRFIRQTILAVK